MAHYYPHLTPRSGDFPHLDAVNVYKYRNDFNYRRWGEQSTLSLCNVPFDYDNENIIDWQTLENRDEQLDALTHYTSEPLKSNFRLDKNDTIKVPIPFDVADGANYLIVRNAKAATVGNLDYEGNDGIKDLFFFILDVEQVAPSTTRLSLKLDIWTTYFHRLDIQGGILERGHVTMWSAATPDQFLGNPFQNTAHLTAEDVTTGTDGQLTTTTNTALMEGAHFYCFALPYDPPAFLTSTGTTPSGYSITSPSFSGDCETTVNGMEWNLGALTPAGDYRTAKTASKAAPAPLGQNSENNAGYFIYAVESSTALEFFKSLFSLFPHIAYEIKELYLVPARLLEIQRTFNIANIQQTIRQVRGRTYAQNIRLAPEDFNFPERYSGLTKLYTSPYSVLTITDGTGQTVDVKVQDTTSELSLNVTASLLSGCNLRAEIEGAGGKSAGYEWTVVSTGAQEQESLSGKAGEFFLEKSLPVYALTMSAQQGHDLATAKKLDNDRARIIQEYSNSQRSNCVNLDNTRRALETALSNANRSAGTSRDNANRSTNSAYQQGTNSNAAGRANDLTNIALGRALNSLHIAGLRRSRDIEVAFLDENVQQQREKTTFNFNVNRQNRAANLAESIDYQAQSLQNTQAAQAAHTRLDQGGGIISNTLSGFANGGILGAAAGLIGGAVDAGMKQGHLSIDQNLATAETTLSIAKETAMAEIETETDRAKINNNVGPHGIGGLATDYSFTEEVVRQRNLTVSNLDAKLALDISQTNQALDLNVAAQNENSLRSYNTTGTNLLLSRDTALSNTAADYSTATANSSADYNTGQANAASSYNVAKNNLQSLLPFAGRNYKAEYDTAGLAASVSIASNGGSGMPLDLKRSGFAWQIRTPNPDDIATLGDFFLRYGYAGRRAYTIDKLALYSKFTFWQLSEVFFRQTANSHIMNSIRRMFANGVTVWRRMEDIGTFCLYENEKIEEE